MKYMLVSAEDVESVGPVPRLTHSPKLQVFVEAVSAGSS